MSDRVQKWQWEKIENLAPGSVVEIGKIIGEIRSRRWTDKGWIVHLALLGEVFVPFGADVEVYR